ncbi:hypothetical protein DH2020_049208 [Rehmannia glutinosa]|uniref:Uncharacterized protein n=1 Tax=Rehmannia glutinosa TaxID=99300 RepID=A0ABR0U3I4_REHGL
MGFPVGYTDIFLPKLLVYLLTVLGLIRKFVFSLFSFLGLGDFLEPGTASYPVRHESSSELRSVSAALIRELLPVVKFSDLADQMDPPENCAEAFNEKMWVASGISDFYGDYSPITTGL